MSESLPKVIRDPVHNLIHLDDDDEGRMALALIQAPEMQRLRRVRQLGMSCLTYPGAEHSRFTHSLGVFHVARCMLDALSAREEEAPELYKILQGIRQTILAAALLHDIGHGPFSHVFEKAIPKPQNAPADYPRNHEGWTERIIHDKLENICLDHEVDVQTVGRIVTGAPTAPLLARDFISSQLDADRLDYLLRDSRSVGVSYGVFDLDWLIHSLRIGPVKVVGEGQPVPRLCLSAPKAVAVVEGFIVARLAMYVQVYVHKTTRAYEAQLLHLFQLARHILVSGEHLPGDCPDVLRTALRGDCLSVDEYLSLDDFMIWSVLCDWARREAEAPGDLLQRLTRKAADIVQRRRPYRAIDLDTLQLREQAIKMEGHLEAGQDLCRFYSHRDRYADVPYKSIFYRKGKEEEEIEGRAIYFIEPNGQTRLAEAESDLIMKISEVDVEVCRVFYDDQEQQAVESLRSYGLI